MTKPTRITKHANGTLGTKQWLKDGKLHREDGPAVITYSDCYDDEIRGMQWYQNGKLHREDGPASLYIQVDYERRVGIDNTLHCDSEQDWYIDSKLHHGYFIHEQKWYQNGELHRLDGPAHIMRHEYDHGADIQDQKWYQNGKLHRLDGPAMTSYTRSGSIFNEQWHQNGKIHRLDGPAVVEYYTYNSFLIFPIQAGVRKVQWYKDGELHRESGPAVITYSAVKKSNPDMKFYGDVGEGRALRARMIRINGIKDISGDGSIVDQQWFIDGVEKTELANKSLEIMPNDNFEFKIIKPVRVTRNADGVITQKRWLQNRKLHRLDGPAKIWYHADGKIDAELWCLDGKKHRLDGPAFTAYRVDGTIHTEQWYMGDQLHKLDGPARVSYRADGAAHINQWYQHGTQRHIDGTYK